MGDPYEYCIFFVNEKNNNGKEDIVQKVHIIAYQILFQSIFGECVDKDPKADFGRTDTIMVSNELNHIL